MAGVDERQGSSRVDEPPLAVEVSSGVGGSAVVRLRGEVDLATVAIMRAGVERALAQQPATLEFDMSGLQFMDSSGLAILVATASQVESIEVHNPTSIVRRVIELSGLTAILPMTP